jgi:hypothetical protein
MRPTWKGRGLPDIVAGNAGPSITKTSGPHRDLDHGQPTAAGSTITVILRKTYDYVALRMDTKFGTFAPIC